MARAKITSKGQVTIPIEVREALALDTGDSIVLEVRGDYAVVRKAPRLADVVAEIADEYPVGPARYATVQEAIEAHVRETWEELPGPVVIVPPRRDAT
ncbi:MAG: AbrB family transcriptional regulator [Coriobacteriaceae bacterium]|nr:AbrB family transcriptional regulator [Coriobacteriaceae bacterium]